MKDFILHPPHSICCCYEMINNEWLSDTNWDLWKFNFELNICVYLVQIRYRTYECFCNVTGWLKGLPQDKRSGRTEKDCLKIEGDLNHFMLVIDSKCIIQKTTIDWKLFVLHVVGLHEMNTYFQFKLLKFWEEGA